MPVQVSYPGVYVEEVPSGVHTITGVSTSVAAFFGRASKGPINRAVRLLSLSDYARQFGEPHPKSDLAHSVRLFFENGGAECYVVRLATGALRARVTLRSLNPTQDVLVATAKAEGVWANTLRLEVDYNTPNPDETFNIQIVQEAEGRVVTTEPFIGLSMEPSSPRFAPSFVTQSSDLIDLALAQPMGDSNLPGAFINTLNNSFPGFSQARRPLGSTGAEVQTTLNGLLNANPPMTSFDISVNGSPFVTVDLTQGQPIPNTITGIETELKSKIDIALSTVNPAATVTCRVAEVNNVGRLLTITSGSGNRSSVRVRRAPANDISAALMLGVEQGGVEPTRWSNFRPSPNATFLRLNSPSTPGNLSTLIPGDLSMLDNLSALQQPGITEIKIQDSTVTLDAPPNDLETVRGQRWFKSAPVPGSPHGDNDGVREKLRIMARAINGTPGIPWRAEVWGYHLAVIAREGTLNTRPTTITTTPANNAVFDLSQANTTGWTANVRQYSLGTAGTGPFSTGVNGEDEVSAPDVPAYLGNPAAQTGLYALDPVDIFNLMVIAGDDEVSQATLNSVWGPASNYCQRRRAFLLVDPPATWSDNSRPEVVQDTTLVNDLRALVVKDHSAVFYPRLRYAANGLTKTIGPSGAIAGLMARIDSTRGVWKAPAGMEADIRGILGLEVKLTDMENGVLNKLGANCLRVFPSGFVNWGARTLDGADDIGSEWKYVPIRRLALFLEESLYRGTKWVVFEPNDEPLWAQIRLNLNAFMMGLFRQGAFQGGTPDQAFYVKCDGETTTQADRNLGIVNIEVGFAPLKPAEFVVIKIQQIAGDL
jgi:uncharacterized protein